METIYIGINKITSRIFSFRSDYEGWKPFFKIPSRINFVPHVLEVTMRDGNSMEISLKSNSTIILF